MKSRVIALVVLPLISAMAPVPSSEVIEAAAQKGSRPTGCAGDAGFWNTPRATRSSQCAKLARGYTLLASDPARARKLASEVRPNSEAAHAALELEARAAVSLRDFPAAWTAFERARVKSPEALFDVGLLHAYARAAAFVGQAERAAAAYRLLMPRVDVLPTRGGVRLAAVVEAAFAVMVQSPAGAAEAVAFLAPQLEQNEYRGGEAVARAALALAADRRAGGAPQKAQPFASAALADPATAPWLVPSDQAALEAFALEASDPDLARAAWTKFLELAPAAHAFRPHAEARRARLIRGSG